MTKKIIIDGVEVAGCIHLSFVEETYCCDCQYEKYALCQGYNCYYKQLKRLEQENTRLKEEIHNLKCPFFFKHTAICLGRKDEMQKYEKCSFYADCNIKQMIRENEHLAEKEGEAKHYLQEAYKYQHTLQEIKEIAEVCCSGIECEECPFTDNCKTDSQALGVCRIILKLITKAEE